MRREDQRGGNGTVPGTRRKAVQISDGTHRKARSGGSWR
jgi:hypothetical protein